MFFKVLDLEQMQQALKPMQAEEQGGLLWLFGGVGCVASVGLDGVRHAAHGQWRNVLERLGVPSKLLNKNHQPCPNCGGKDRFRFTDYQGRGGFICNQCTPNGGSGFDLLALVFGYSFADAVNEVKGALGLARTDKPPIVRSIQQTPAQAPPKDNSAAVLQLWGRCADDAGFTDYLSNRGLSVLPDADLRFCASLPYWHGGQCLGHFAAMVAAFRDASGELVGVHITYLQRNHAGQLVKLKLTHDGEALPSKKMRVARQGALSGAAIRLFAPVDGVLAVCEGIENALAARQLFGLPVWACGSAGGLAKVAIPPSVNKLLIVADNDAAGREAAERLARRLQGVNVRIWSSETAGFDALDELTKGAK